MNILECPQHGAYFADLGACPRCDEAMPIQLERLPNKSATPKQPSRKHMLDGIQFDSGIELARYEYLKQAASAGIIQDLVCHPEFELLPNTPIKAIKVADLTVYPKFTASSVKYTADFAYHWHGYRIVEDVKGETRRKGKGGSYSVPLVDSTSRLRHNVLLALNARYWFDMFYYVTTSKRNGWQFWHKPSRDCNIPDFLW